MVKTLPDTVLLHLLHFVSTPQGWAHWRRFLFAVCHMAGQLFSESFNGTKWCFIDHDIFFTMLETFLARVFHLSPWLITSA